MSCGTSIRAKVKAIEVLVRDSGDPVPSASVSNAIEIKEGTDIEFDPELLSQDDVANDSFSPVADKAGKLVSNGTIEANLKSTDQTLAPSIAPLLKLAGMTETTIARVELDLAPTNVSLGDTVTNGTQTATVKAIVNNASAGVYALIVKMTSGAFADDDELTNDGDEVGTVNGSPTNCFLYEPNTNSTTSGSFFAYTDGTRRAVKNAKSNVMISAENGGFATVQFDLLGAYDLTNWGDASMPTISKIALANPLFMGAQLKIGSYSPVVSSIEFNLGNNVVNVGDANAETGICGASIIDRTASGGNVVIKEAMLSTFDYISAIRNQTEYKMSYFFGNGEKTKSVFVYQNIAITQAQRTVIDNINYITLTFKAVGSNDDECYLVFT